jgi:hypothetical protein
MANIDDLKFLEEQFIRCYDDVTYMAQFCTVRTLANGYVPFNLYDFQISTLKQISKHDKVIITKSRQMGISTLLALETLHKLIFNDGYKVTVFANKQKTAEEVIDKIKLMYDRLPDWLKTGLTVVNKNKLELQLSNGSGAKAFSSSSDAGRSQSANMVIMDEGAFIPNLEETMKAVLPVISTGGKLIILSSPNGIGNHFYKVWEEAMEGKNGFLPIKLKWDLHPDRDQRWRDEQDATMGKLGARQEYDAEFVGSGNTVVDADDLKWMYDNLEEPIEKSGESLEFWRWSYPVFGKQYAIIVDTAKGDGGDDSTVQVIDIETNEQVAELDGQFKPKELARKAIGIALEYNEGVLIIENTGIGSATTEEAEAIGYNNLYRVRKGVKDDDYSNYTNSYVDPSQLVTGYTMSWSVRPVAVSKLEYLIRSRSIKIKSMRTYSEFSTFIYVNGRQQASFGCHDDLIMPLAIYADMRDKILIHSNRASDYRKTILANITMTTAKPKSSVNPIFQQQVDTLSKMGIDYNQLFGL